MGGGIMPRQPRVYSNTGIYHIMIRGINGEEIFNKVYYKSKVLNIIREISEELVFYIIAYCIMDNHMHLLLKIGEEELAIFMKRINIKFAMYYNKLENRYGHVFQDRFKSEAVEDERYYLGVLRYIHNNPVKARISNNIINYKWSSINDYINQNTDIISETHLKEILGLFKNLDDFIEFHNDYDDIIYIDTKEDKYENIQFVINNIIKDFVGKYGFSDHKQIRKKQKEELAEMLLKREICSLKEIASLCRLSVKDVVALNKKVQESI